jgi:hypothetical protein
MPQDLVRSLTGLLSERGLNHHQPEPVFVGSHNARLTRFGATHIVRRAAAQAVSIRPSLEGKAISPQFFRRQPYPYAGRKRDLAAARLEPTPQSPPISSRHRLRP